MNVKQRHRLNVYVRQKIVRHGMGMVLLLLLKARTPLLLKLSFRVMHRPIRRRLLLYLALPRIRLPLLLRRVPAIPRLRLHTHRLPLLLRILLLISRRLRLHLRLSIFQPRAPRSPQNLTS